MLPIIECTNEESGDLEVTGVFTTDTLVIGTDHPFEGHDIRDLVREAIEFWTTSLNYIEAARGALYSAEATGHVTNKPPSLFSGQI